MRKRISRWVAIVAAITLLSVIGASTTAHAATSDGPDINAQPVTNLKKGGTLVWAINSLPDNFNSSQIDGRTVDTRHIMDSTLPAFFKVDASGKLVVDRNYAISVKLTSKTPQVVTYRINLNAKWSDGKAVGLADFVGMWKANNGSNSAFETVSATGYEDIASIETGPDTNSVVVTFNKTYADWQRLFGGLLPSSVTASPTAFNTSWKNGPDLTAGPFKYASTDVTAETVTLIPNPRWWGPKPVLSKIVYRAIPSAAQLDALANGEVDFIDIGSSEPNLKRARTLAGVKVRISKTPNYRQMTFGSATVISRDVRVRQAIMVGMNRTAIARELIGSIDPSATSLDNHIFVKGLSCYQDNSGVYGQRNLARARALLDAAGWKGNPRKNPQGVALKIAVTIPAGVPASAREAKLMKTMLAPLGVPLEIKVVSLSDFETKYITPGDFEMTVFEWRGTSLSVSGASGILTTAGEQNYGKIGSKAIDALFKKANEELDPVKRCALANRADKLVWEIGHSMALYQLPSVTATDGKLANMGSFGFTNIDYTRIGFTK